MKTLLRLLLITTLCIAALAPAAAYAQDHGDEGEAPAEEHGGGTSFIGGPDWDDAKEVTIWSIVGIGVFATVLGVLYLFKRKVGGFPENPTWSGRTVERMYVINGKSLERLDRHLD
jgi:hypothetical protein